MNGDSTRSWSCHIAINVMYRAAKRGFVDGDHLGKDIEDRLHSNISDGRTMMSREYVPLVLSYHIC